MRGINMNHGSDDGTLLPSDADQLARAREAMTLAEGFTSGAQQNGAVERRAMPERIADFRLLSKIGEGGMGVVFLAEQERPRRQVALKLLRSGDLTAESRRRFEFEVELLARLEHPGVARLYDAGLVSTPTGDQPYFAMEYVRGVRIDEYVRGKRHTSLSNGAPVQQEDVLGLLVQVCRAIEAAHRCGIIHRDIKPANILIDDKGQPKVLDFGVAKLAGESAEAIEQTRYTRDGQVIGTPAYMAPEQARGKLELIGFPTDVYALGVLAYELLCGQSPYSLDKMPLDQVIQTICEREPSRLSVVDRRLRGDVETVIGKAMAKEPQRRYSDAGTMADDLQRILNNEPVAARPTSTWYQLSKFSKRHRAIVSGAAATAVALILGSAVSLAYAIEARRQQAAALSNERRAVESAERADQQAAEANRQRGLADEQRLHATLKASELQAVVDFMQIDVFGNATPESIQDKAVRDEIVIKMLEPALKSVRTKFADQPLVLASVLNQIGLAYESLGRSAEAESPIREALELRRKLLGPEQVDTYTSLSSLGNVLRSLSRPVEAEPLYREAWEGSRRVLGAENVETLTCLNNLAGVVDALGRRAEAEPLYREAWDGMRRTLGVDNRETIVCQINFAGVLEPLGRATEAVPLYRDALERSRRVLGEDHPYSFACLNNLANVLESLNRPLEAEQLYRDALERSKRVLGEDHAYYLISLNNLANVLDSMGRTAEAETLYRDALERSRRQHGEYHSDTLISLNNLAQACASLGRLEEAASLHREALEGRRRSKGDDHPDTLQSMNNLAYALRMLDRVQEAEPLYREAAERSERAQGEDDKDTLIFMSNRAEALVVLDRAGDAEPILRKVWERRSRSLGAEDRKTLEALGNLAAVLVQLGRDADAEPIFAQGVESAVAGLGWSDAYTRTLVFHYVQLLRRIGKTQEADALRDRYRAAVPGSGASATKPTVESAPTTTRAVPQ
jgi:serine/threonine protein kinase/tetratricopeptide (TPR) repeat protein